MLTGIVVGAGIMLTYLALFGFAGRKLRSIDHSADQEPYKVAVMPPRNRR